MERKLSADGMLCYCFLCSAVWFSLLTFTRLTITGYKTQHTYACLSHFDPQVHESHETWAAQLQNAPVRIQWDPERDIQMNKLDYRAIQIGLSGLAVQMYVKEWMVGIEDITDKVIQIKKYIDQQDTSATDLMLPDEKIYHPTNRAS